MSIIETDILIVGGGVAGAALACALRHQNYRITLVEQRKEKLDTARGDHFQPYTVELLARWGVLDKFFARGAGKRIAHEFRTAAGETLLAVKYDELPISYPYFLVFHHDLIAELFLELAAENPNFVKLQPVVARQFEADDKGIHALTVTLPNGETATIKPHLVIGADGASSSVRAALHFTALEHAYQHPMVALFGTRPATLKPDDYFFRYAGRTGMLVIQQRMDNRIKVTLPVGAEGISWWKKSTPAERAQVLSERAHILRDFDSEIAGFYPVKMVHCHEYVKGNVALIGDAAHAIHPARGQGLNMGLQSLPKLIEALPAPTKIGHPDILRWDLQLYQNFQKPLYDRIIARNHEAALAMDASAEGDVAALMRQQDEQIRQIHTQPELRRLHLLETTGYPFGIPGKEEIDYQA
ncbi:MAG: FAD-dependent monooxygenase [Acidobacteria bacterium]|nr:FAD-dependent monooxygenase [Acidobacteriota bacterium]MBI3424731.1 FAD-dependent monooxygenase [Acidobacteriota bacterium]